MEIFHFNAFYGLFVGFGFVFTVKSIQEQVLTVFRNTNNGKNKKKADQKIKTITCIEDFIKIEDLSAINIDKDKIEANWNSYKTKIEVNSISLLMMKDKYQRANKEARWNFLNDTLNQGKKAVNRGISNLFYFSEKKDFTRNFNFLSLISALIYLFLIVVGIILRNIKDDGGLESRICIAIFTLEIAYLICFILFYLSDMPFFKSLNIKSSIPPKITIGFLILMICSLSLSFILTGMTGIIPDKYIFWGTLIFVLHYLAYTLRTFIIIPDLEKRTIKVAIKVREGLKTIDEIDSIAQELYISLSNNKTLNIIEKKTE